MTETDFIPPIASETAAARSGVLARKYRPETFDSLIGQDATVRMLKNALDQDRVAQALVFSGVRGTGKTTLARIVAKGLNCLAADRPTSNPCGACQNCREIAQGNSLDVQEIDAASHTGVDHIRDLIGSVSYRAAGRYKVYILDEVHMLSTSAFNALLKTLEEPPAHVRFIFATTEIRKIPPTVLSRTQRFALRRVRADELSLFLAGVVVAEGMQAETESLDLIARAGEGSVRDALSMLDQFLSGSSGNLTGGYVREQLGLASSGAVLALFQALIDCDGPEMLRLLDSERSLGTDPVSIVRDLLAICHQLSRHKVLSQAPDHDYSEAEQTSHHELAAAIPMGQVARLWQLLLKGADEVKTAPDPAIALEMLMIRAHYLSDVPTPEQILNAQRLPQQTVKQNQPTSAKEAVKPKLVQQVVAQPEKIKPEPKFEAETKPQQAFESENPDPTAEDDDIDDTVPTEISRPPVYIRDFAALVSVLEDNNESFMASLLYQEAQLVHFALGTVSLYLPKQSHGKMQNLAQRLDDITGQSWTVDLLDNLSADVLPTLSDQAAVKKEKLMEQVQQDGLMQEMANLFPGSELTRLVSKD